LIQNVLPFFQDEYLLQSANAREFEVFLNLICFCFERKLLIEVIESIVQRLYSINGRSSLIGWIQGHSDAELMSEAIRLWDSKFLKQKVCEVRNAR